MVLRPPNIRVLLAVSLAFRRHGLARGGIHLGSRVSSKLGQVRDEVLSRNIFFQMPRMKDMIVIIYERQRSSHNCPQVQFMMEISFHCSP